MPECLYDGEIFADYFQFYLRDADHSGLPDDYSDESIARYLMAGPHGVIVNTARNMTVAVRVTWYEQKPDTDGETVQHLAEAGFDCPTGVLVLAGMTDALDTAARLAVTAGPIGIRINLSGLDSISDDGLDGSDHYHLQLWPGVEAPEVRVLKAWPPA